MTGKMKEDSLESLKVVAKFFSHVRTGHETCAPGEGPGKRRINSFLLFVIVAVKENASNVRTKSEVVTGHLFEPYPLSSCTAHQSEWDLLIRRYS